MRRIFKKFSPRLPLAVITFLAVLAGSATGQSDAVQPTPKPENRDIRSLELGKEIERELRGSAVHIYSINLAAGQFVRLVVEQRGIDVTATLTEPGGKKIVEVDSANGTEGPELVTAVAEAAGSYQLEVRSLEKDVAPGRYAARIEELRAATTEDKERITGLAEAVKLMDDASELTQQGKYDEAIPIVEKSLTLRERFLGTEHYEVAVSLDTLAGLYEFKGDYLRAEPLYRRSLMISEKTLGAEHSEVAVTLVNMAGMYRAKGDYIIAESLYQRALTIYEKTLGTEHFDYAITLGNLARLYQKKGDYVRAESLYQRELAIFDKTIGIEPLHIATALVSLAQAYLEQGDYARAEPILQRALTIYETKLGAEHPYVASTLSSLAELYRGQGNYIRAEPLFKRTLAIYEKRLGAEHPFVARTLNNFAGLYLTEGDYIRAESLYRRSLLINEKMLGANHPDVASPLHNLARLYEMKEDYARAVSLRIRGNEIQEYNLNLILASGSENQKQLYLATLSNETDDSISLHSRFAPTNETAFRLALTTILRRKGRVLDATSNQVNALRRRLAPQDVVLLEQLITTRSQLAALAVRGLGNASPEQYQASVAKLQSENERLEAVISTRSTEFRAESQPITIDRVRSAIPSDAALIEITSYRPYNIKAKKTSERYGASRYAAYLLRRTGLPSWVDLGEASVIDRDVAKLRKALNDSQLRDPATIKQLARALDAKLMFPIRKLLGNTRHVLLSPDGALNLLPFGALVDERGRYLIENYSFTYLTSGRDLLRFEVKAENTQAPIIFANPSFDTGVTSGKADFTSTDASRGKRSDDFREEKWAALPATQEEAAGIKALMPEARVFTTTNATESALKQVEQPRILHIASHGFFLEDKKDEKSIENPLLRSGLILAGANKRQSGAGEDGILTSLEAAGLNLWGTKLVVLSACDTGVGDVQNGEGVYGLRRALVLAGAESQLFSLWKVQDAAAGDLMVEFYRRLQRGEGRTEALRQSQLTMLRGAKDLRRHPYFWASFIQSGDWRSIVSSKPNAR